MNCNQCPYTNHGSGNGNELPRPSIIHPQGNYIQLSIPITMRVEAVTDGDNEVMEMDQISDSAQVRIELVKGKKAYSYTPIMEGNRAVISDKGKLPVGTYDIVVLLYEDGVSARYKKRTLLQVVDTAETGGQYVNDEINVIAMYPIIKGKTTAIIVGDDSVTISEAGKFQGDDTPGDNYADIKATYGDGSVSVGDNDVTITI